MVNRWRGTSTIFLKRNLLRCRTRATTSQPGVLIEGGNSQVQGGQPVRHTGSSGKIGTYILTEIGEGQSEPARPALPRCPTLEPSRVPEVRSGVSGRRIHCPSLPLQPVQPVLDPPGVPSPTAPVPPSPGAR